VKLRSSGYFMKQLT